MRRKTAAVSLAAFAASCFAPVARAEDPPKPPPSDVGQITQYVEVLPTATGGVPTSSLRKRPGRRGAEKLAPAARKALTADGGDDRAALEQLVASSGPDRARNSVPKSGAATETRSRRTLPATPPGADSGSAFSAVSTISAGATRGRVVAIALAMLLLTAASVAAAHVRLRRRTPAM